MKVVFSLMFTLILSSCICDPEDRDAENKNSAKKEEVKVVS